MNNDIKREPFQQSIGGGNIRFPSSNNILQNKEKNFNRSNPRSQGRIHCTGGAGIL